MKPDKVNPLFEAIVHYHAVNAFQPQPQPQQQQLLQRSQRQLLQFPILDQTALTTPSVPDLNRNEN
jgi:hypothetical protein